MHPPNFGLIGPLQVLELTDCFFGYHETPYWRIFLTKSRYSLSWLPRDSLQPDLQPQILLSSMLPSLLFWIEVLLQVKTFGGDNNFDETLQIVFSSALFEVFQQSPHPMWGGDQREVERRGGRADSSSSSPCSLATSCRDSGAREASWLPSGSSLNCSCPASPPASTLQLRPSWAGHCCGIGLLGC